MVIRTDSGDDAARRRLARLSVTLAVAGACALLAALTRPTVARSTGNASSEPVGVIAFEAKSGLYTVDAQGGTPRLMPGSKPGDGDPRWSPDGTRIAFDRATGSDEDSRDIFVMDADGTQQRRLTSAPGLDNWPEWAPNGRTLVFTSERGGVARGVYAISIRTGAARRVAYGINPAWTPDGRIIFAGTAARAGERGKIFTVRPYGADRRPLPSQPGKVIAVRVSPDGQHIAYVTRTFDVYAADSSGAHPRALAATNDDEENDAAWSPDGGWVVYDVGPPGTQESSGTVYKSDVHVIRLDGTDDKRLTTMGACCANWRTAVTSPSG